ncbi:hypothetical protein C8J56DRAFT_901476 [Mycena floridula]|nr:hypothetical protein C8J56DRAFT_901476 [Mycena floridula]
MLSLIDTRIAQFTLLLDMKDGGHYLLQAMNRKEMNMWIEMNIFIAPYNTIFDGMACAAFRNVTEEHICGALTQTVWIFKHIGFFEFANRSQAGTNNEYNCHFWVNVNMPYLYIYLLYKLLDHYNISTQCREDLDDPKSAKNQWEDRLKNLTGKPITSQNIQATCDLGYSCAALPVLLARISLQLWILIFLQLWGC